MFKKYCRLVFYLSCIYILYSCILCVLDHHRRRLDTLRDEYDTELATIKKEFDDERDLVETCHKDEIQRLQDVLFAMEQNHQEKEAEARQDFQSMRDEIKNKVSPTIATASIAYFHVLRVLSEHR